MNVKISKKKNGMKRKEIMPMEEVKVLVKVENGQKI